MQPTCKSKQKNGVILYICFILLIFISFPGFSAPPQMDKIEKLIAEFEGDFSVPQVLPSQAMSDPSVIFVDVREKEERDVSIIRGALSKDEFEQAIQKNSKKLENKKIVAYCTIGYRSSKYVEQLLKKGQKAFNLRGSILAWVHEGGEIVNTRGQPTTMLHVFGKKWDAAPKGFETKFKKNWFQKLMP